MLFRKQFLVVTISMFVFWTAIVHAKTTTLTPEDHGVLGAMRRIGCRNPQWLGRIMIESGILESQLRKLPVGKSIVVPDECFSAAPTPEDVTIARQVFAAQSALEGVESAAKEKQALMDELATEVAKNTVNAATIEILQGKIGQLQNDLSAKNRAMENGGRSPFVVTGFVIGLLNCFVVLFFFYVRPLKRRLANAKEKISELQSASPQGAFPRSIEFHGEVIHFKDTTVHTVGCPACHEVKIKPHPDNMRQHYEKHTHLRVIEGSPEEVRELLIIAAGKQQ
jgi:hypothetical protein